MVYFYPNDYRPDRRYIKAVDPFVQDIQSWYKEKLGKTFYAKSVEVIKGQKPASDYGPPEMNWVNVYAELGIDCNSNTNVTTLVFLARTLQHANGRTCSPIGTWYNSVYNGDVTVSEANFDAEIMGTCPGVPSEDYWWRCNMAAQRGGIAHELGHAFSLAHPEGCEVNPGYSWCDATVMWAWWFWPDVGFLDISDTPYAPEASTLLASPWFQ
ncbi:MAG: hypothetical protein Q8Q06_03560 [bacterium]|nr:hypothetical protein [bacterium]